MSVIQVEALKKNLAECLQKVAAGETLVITSQDRAIAELRPTHVKLGGPRPFGLCAGEFVVPDDFDAPLPEQVVSAFESR
jgi:antitoxin (DNA-binding transcriptional repressor) of toxin-antitoxin stability system